MVPEPNTSRRHLLATAAMALAGTAAGCTQSSASNGPADTTTEPPTDSPTDSPTPTETATEQVPYFDGWLEHVDNYDGEIADHRGEETVTVTVGATGNGGEFAFDPPVVQIDPGATVRWKWSGNGGGHNVVADDDTFDSDDIWTDPGVHFEHTFESAGIHRYYCAPHHALGMKGVVVVGDDYPTKPRSEVADDREDEDETPESDDHDEGTPAEFDEPGPYGGYLDDSSSFDGTPADRTDTDEVVVTVGATGNGGEFSFDPPAVRIRPGTTVRWKWTGNGGGHNVVAEDGSFDSGEVQHEMGFHLEHTFEETGVHRYYCAPHKALGMRGVVEVVAE